MQNPDGNLGNDHLGNIKNDLNTDRSLSLPTMVLESLKRPSNQVIIKNDDGSLQGLRYVVAPESSALRPLKAWTIHIEQWLCKEADTIETEDVLFMRLLKTPTEKYHTHKGCVKDIIVKNNKIAQGESLGFQAVIAASVLINKIDAGRMPDIEKTLRLYNLTKS